MSSNAEPTSVSNLSAYDNEADDSTNEGLISILSIAAVVIALIALAFQLMTANIWTEGNLGSLFS